MRISGSRSPMGRVWSSLHVVLLAAVCAVAAVAAVLGGRQRGWRLLLAVQQPAAARVVDDGLQADAGVRAEAWPGGGRPSADVCLGALGPVAGEGVELAEELGEQGDEVEPGGERASGGQVVG